MQLDYRARVRNIVLIAAEAAKQDMAANAANEPFNLFVKPCTNTEDGMLRMFPKSVTPPNDWKPAGAGPMGIDIPYDQYFTWIHSRSGQLPILAPEF